jgi:hypothetical protein
VRRPIIALPQTVRGRSRSAVVVSVVFHVLAVLGLAHVLSMPTTLSRFFERTRGEVPVERVGFLSIPSSTTGEDTPGRSGGDGSPLRPREEPRPLAPASVPVGVPVAPTDALRDPEGGSGPLVGLGGPTQGVRPAYRDPRLWREPGAVASAPRSVRETIDSTIVAEVGRFNDSLVAARLGRAPGDWTFEKDGKRYGMEPGAIWLGGIRIPVPVVFAPPMNPTTRERDRALAYMTRDIQYHAQRAVSEDEFRRNVRNLRVRKERERERERAEERGEEPAAQ